MREPLVRHIVETAVAQIAGGARADGVLDRALRNQRDLSSEERRCVAEWTLGIALWRGRLDAMAAGDQSLWLGLFLIDRERQAFDEAARLSGQPVERLQKAAATEPPADPVERLAYDRSLPPWLARRWTEQLGLARADRLAAVMNERGPITVRTNTLRATRAELQARLHDEGIPSEPLALSDTALQLVGRANIFALESWRQGWFEVQDAGSQVIANLVAAQPGDLVLDLCAGSGGKTLALAAAMADRGRLIAVDVDARRIADLKVRLRRAGLTCVEMRCGDVCEATLTEDLVGQADAVLVDAPCSALGTLRRSPDARWRMPVDEPDRWVPLQTELLHSATRLVRPGGRLVYATCSVDSAENGGVACTVRAPDFVREHERTLWPDEDGCDGFFCATWKRLTKP